MSVQLTERAQRTHNRALCDSPARSGSSQNHTALELVLNHRQDARDKRIGSDRKNDHHAESDKPGGGGECPLKWVETAPSKSSGLPSPFVIPLGIA